QRILAAGHPISSKTGTPVARQAPASWEVQASLTSSVAGTLNPPSKHVEPASRSAQLARLLRATVLKSHTLVAASFAAWAELARWPRELLALQTKLDMPWFVLRVFHAWRVASVRSTLKVQLASLRSEASIVKNRGEHAVEQAAHRHRGEKKSAAHRQVAHLLQCQGGVLKTWAWRRWVHTCSESRHQAALVAKRLKTSLAMASGSSSKKLAEVVHGWWRRTSKMKGACKSVSVMLRMRLLLAREAEIGQITLILKSWRTWVSSSKDRALRLRSQEEHEAENVRQEQLLLDGHKKMRTQLQTRAVAAMIFSSQKDILPDFFAAWKLWLRTLYKSRQEKVLKHSD
ncbi:unnamed protein product, partial [Polarella glacialis]